MSKVTLAVIKVGSSWKVMDAAGEGSEFPSRSRAIVAAERLVMSGRTRGDEFELLVQDEAGELRIHAVLQAVAGKDPGLHEQRLH